MTWYLGITTTRLMAAWPGAEKERGEFAVERQLLALGIDAWAPRKIEFKRQGKRRYADAVTTAYLPGYVFFDASPAQFHTAIQCRGLRPTVLPIHPSEVKAHVDPFRRAVEAENAEAERIIERQDRAAMCAFTAGEALTILAGPFMDRAVSFVRMVHNASDGLPMVEFEAELFGRTVKGRADVLDVKRAV